MKALTLSNPTLRSRGPFAPFHEMDQWLDDMFNGFGSGRGQSASTLPTVEVHQAETEYRIAVDLPGVELGDIDLSFSDGLLTLKGERKPADGEALYSSRWSGPFERVIGVGTDVDVDRISAAFKNGVLTITLPKKPERQPRRIEVQ